MSAFFERMQVASNVHVTYNEPVSEGKYGYKRISSGLAPFVTRFHGLIPH